MGAPYYDKVDIDKMFDIYRKEMFESLDSVNTEINGKVNTTENLSLKEPGVYRAETSGTIGGVVVKEGYYTLLRKEGGVWKLESKVKMPMQDLTEIETELENTKNKVDDFIENFTVTTDTEFNENSKNPIANEAVTPLAQTLDYFISNPLKLVSETVIEKTNLINGVLYKDNTIFKDRYLRTIKDLVVGDNTHLYFDGVRCTTDNTTHQKVLTSVLGIRANGTMESLLGVKAGSQLTREQFLIDIKGFEKISISYNVYDVAATLGTDLFFRKYEGMEVFDAVKEYVDEGLDPLDGFDDLYGNEETISNTVKFSDISKLTINGVEPVSSYLLTQNNTIYKYTAPNATFYVWKNIPVKYNNKKITKIDLDFLRTGAALNCNLLGVKNDVITPIILGQNPYLGILESQTIDVSDYDFISIYAGYSTIDELSLKQKIITYSVQKIEDTKGIVLKYIDEKLGDVKTSAKVTTDKQIYVNRPTSLPIVNIIGVLPTDTSDTRTPTNVEFEYYEDTRMVFKCKSEFAIQGSSTALLPKKGFETKFTNFNDEKLKVQFGGWLPTDSFHIKSFPSDRTFSRDLAYGKVWEKIRKSRPFPGNYIADFHNGNNNDSTPDNLMEQALFYLDGFPIELRVNGAFYGVYFLRLKKERENYMFNEANENHIFIDNEVHINWTSYEPAGWKIRSPKNVTANVTANLNRFFNWCAGIKNGTVDFEATCNDYINVDSFVDWLINQQLCTAWDSQINNMLIGFYDGKKANLFPYDGDLGFGGSYTGFEVQNPLVIDAQKLYWRGTFWKDTLYPKLKNRIQTRWTELRNNNIISIDDVYSIFKENNSKIPRNLLEQDLSKWADIPYKGKGRQTVRYAVDITNKRFAELDAVWKL